MSDVTPQEAREHADELHAKQEVGTWDAHDRTEAVVTIRSLAAQLEAAQERGDHFEARTNALRDELQAAQERVGKMLEALEDIGNRWPPGDATWARNRALAALDKETP